MNDGYAGLRKANGGISGQSDFCDSGDCALAGEGDCDSNDGCVGGIGPNSVQVCVADVGFRFNMTPTHDVCLPRHCANRILDGNETAIECGGACGPCDCEEQALVLGSECTPGCPCAVGAGACDSNLGWAVRRAASAPRRARWTGAAPGSLDSGSCSTRGSGLERSCSTKGAIPSA